MSYILEALRRSQAERERGRVPGLDAQPAPADPDRGQRSSPQFTRVHAGLGLTLLLAALAVAAWQLQQPRLAPSAPAVPVPAAAPNPPLSPGVPLPLPPPPRPLALPQVVSAPPAVALPARPAPPAASAAARVAAPVISAQPPPQAAAPRALTLAELTADQRRELPAMIIGGSVWSDNAANRFVIVNGTVTREGDSAAPGVALERIGPRSATLRWRDLRIEVPL